jgi:hypothetical protein
MPKTRRTRRYGLFGNRNGTWERIYDALAFPKATAVRMFQSAPPASAFG